LWKIYFDNFLTFVSVKNLVIIGLVIPEPASTAAGKRMMQLIGLFEEKGYTITFLTSSKNTEFSEKIAFQEIEINNGSFDELIKKLNPDVVLFDRYISEEQFGWRVSENCPDALKILDTEDLHFLREARSKAFLEKRSLQEEDLMGDVFKREMASLLRCDLSLIISEFEMKLLTEKFRIDPEILFYLPFLSDSKIPFSKKFNERKNFVSIGNFLHYPNWQTVLELKRIWKNIRKELPETELHIFGAYASEKVYQLHNEREGFLVKGRADSVENVFNNYRILLAPIPFGAGLKGKLFESMLFGIPNITTSTGAEAMHGNLDWNGFVEDKDDDFIAKSVALYQDQNLWKTAQQNGYQILKTIFDEKFFVLSFFEKISAVQKQLHLHRNRNFLGQILQYHHLNSTKYMSRWIEEKNKNQQ